MANLSFSSTATLAVTGITPGAGPTSTVKVNASFAGSATAADDRVAQTFTVNANTSATVVDLGKIVAGKALWVECDGPLHITLTQDLGAGPVDNIVKVKKFMYLDSDFTAIKVANPSATTAVHMSINVVGDRLPVGGGPGVF
jgi:hypothetical protein